MSRKKNRQRQFQRQIVDQNRKNKQHSSQQSKPRRYIISLEEWKQFEEFRSKIPHIEESLDNLQENWNSLVCWMTEELFCTEPDFKKVNEDFTRLHTLVSGIPYKPLAERIALKPKYKNMVAEILIEDVSDGDL